MTEVALRMLPYDQCRKRADYALHGAPYGSPRFTSLIAHVSVRNATNERMDSPKQATPNDPSFGHDQKWVSGRPRVPGCVMELAAI